MCPLCPIPTCGSGTCGGNDLQHWDEKLVIFWDKLQEAELTSAWAEFTASSTGGAYRHCPLAFWRDVRAARSKINYITSLKVGTQPRISAQGSCLPLSENHLSATYQDLLGKNCLVLAVVVLYSRKLQPKWKVFYRHHYVIRLIIWLFPKYRREIFMKRFGFSASCAIAAGWEFRG